MAVILKQMEIGPMQNYQYFIGCDETRQVAIVDPAWDTDLILQEAENAQYQIALILLTHGHSDHTEGAGRLSEALSIPVIISADEAPFYLPECPDLRTVHDHDRIPIGNINVECLSTPGHTPGCMCFKCGDILLTGDTLFVSGCGRCDLPGGDAAQMYHSLYDVLLKLPDSTIIYPGHRYGPSSSADLKSLRQSNTYLTCRTKEEFLATRMGY